MARLRSALLRRASSRSREPVLAGTARRRRPRSTRSLGKSHEIRERRDLASRGAGSERVRSRSAERIKARRTARGHGAHTSVVRAPAGRARPAPGSLRAGKASLARGPDRGAASLRSRRRRSQPPGPRSGRGTRGSSPVRRSRMPRLRHVHGTRGASRAGGIRLRRNARRARRALRRAAPSAERRVMRWSRCVFPSAV